MLFRKIRSSRKPSKKSRKRLELPMEAVVPCNLKTKKRPNKLQVTDSETKQSNKLQKTKHPCMVEAHASTRKRSERNLSKGHEDHIAEQVFNSLGHCNLARKFVPILQATEIPDAKAAVDKEWEKLEKLQAWHMTKVKSKKVVAREVGSPKQASNRRRRTHEGPEPLCVQTIGRASKHVYPWYL